MTVTRFSLAVDRRKDEVDFFNVTTFGKTAEFADKYLKKGMKILLSGRIQNDSYEKDGKKVTQTLVIGEVIEFAEAKKEQTEEPKKEPPVWAPVPDHDSEQLPFVF